MPAQRRTRPALLLLGMHLLGALAACETGKTPPSGGLEPDPGLPFGISDAGIFSNLGPDATDPFADVPLWNPSTMQDGEANIVWRTPFPNAEQVDPRTPIEVDFSIPVDLAAVLVYDDSDGVDVAGSSDFLGDHILWTPTRPLRFGHTYTVQLFMGASVTAWSFTVESPWVTQLPTPFDAYFGASDGSVWSVSQQAQSLVGFDPPAPPRRTVALDFTPNDVCANAVAVFVVARDGSQVAEIDLATLETRRTLAWTEAMPLDPDAAGPRVHCGRNRLWLIDGQSPAHVWSFDLHAAEPTAVDHGIEVPASSSLQAIAASEDGSALFVSSLQEVDTGARVHLQRYDTGSWMPVSSVSFDVRTPAASGKPLPLFFNPKQQRVITANRIFEADDLTAASAAFLPGEVVWAVNVEHQLAATASQVVSLIDLAPLATLNPALAGPLVFDADGALYATDPSLDALITAWLYR